jgi:hypothetical protein
MYVTTDWNLIKQNGWYHGLNLPHAPGPGWFQVEVISYDSNLYVVQEAWRFDNGAIQARYRRTMSNGTWGVPVGGDVNGWYLIEPIGDPTLPSRLQSFSYGRGAQVADANLAVSNGFYSMAGGANSPPLIQGYENWCHLWVNTSDQNQQVSQMCFPFWDNAVYFRRMHSSVWQAWVKISPIDDYNLPSRLLGHGANQQVGADANGWRMNGWYQCTTSTANLPSGQSWGGLEVINLDNTSGRQIYYPHNSMLVYMRMWVSDGASWSGWKVIVDSGVPGTTRRTIGGRWSGTLDGAAQARINFGFTAVNVVCVVVTNAHNGKANVFYSALDLDVNGFTLYGWTVSNTPDANGSYDIMWQATLDM